MSTWTDIPHQNIEPEKPIRAMDIWAISENIKALSEGADGAPRIINKAFSNVEAGNVIAFKGGAYAPPNNNPYTIPDKYFIAKSGSINLELNVTVAGASRSIAVRLNNVIVADKGVTNGVNTFTINVTAGDYLDMILRVGATINSMFIKVTPESIINSGNIIAIRQS